MRGGGWSTGIDVNEGIYCRKCGGFFELTFAVTFCALVPLREHSAVVLKGDKGGPWTSDAFIGGIGGAVGRAGGAMKGELGPMSDWTVWKPKVVGRVSRAVGPARSERMAPLAAAVGKENWRE